MPEPLSLEHGVAHDLADPIVGWGIKVVTGDRPRVELIASIQSLQGLALPVSRGRTATSVAFRMDIEVAIELYRKIGDLAAKMDWQLPPEGER